MNFPYANEFTRIQNLLSAKTGKLFRNISALLENFDSNTGMQRCEHSYSKSISLSQLKYLIGGKSLAISAFRAIILCMSTWILTMHAEAQILELRYEPGQSNQIIADGASTSYPDILAYYALTWDTAGGNSTATSEVVTEKNGKRIDRVGDEFWDDDHVPESRHPNFKGNEVIYPTIFGNWYLSSPYADQGISCNRTYCFSLIFVPDAEEINKLRPTDVIKQRFIVSYTCDFCFPRRFSQEISMTISTDIGADLSGFDLNSRVIQVSESEPAVLAISVPENMTMTESITIPYSISTTGTATLNSDFRNPPNLSVTIPHGATSGTISIPLVDDSTHEESEQFTVTLNDGTNYTISPAVRTATVVILDDDPENITIPRNKECHDITKPGSVTTPVTQAYWKMGAPMVGEEIVVYKTLGSTFNVLIGFQDPVTEMDETLDGPNTFDFAIFYINGEAENPRINNNAQSGSDSTGRKIGSPGNFSGGYLSYRIIPKELENETWYSVGAPCEFHIWWTSQDKPGITLTIDESTVDEGNSFRVRATATPAPNRDLLVPVSLSSTSRIEGPQNFSVRIEAGDTSGYRDVKTVYMPGDQTSDSVTATTEWRSAYWLDDSAKIKSDSVTIREHNKTFVEFESSDLAIKKIESGTVELTVKYEGVNSRDITVDYQIGDDSDTADASDFMAPTNTEVTIQSGTNKAMISIPIKEDLIHEETESFTVKIVETSNTLPGDNSVAIISIIDDDSETIVLPDTACHAIAKPSAVTTPNTRVYWKEPASKVYYTSEEEIHAQVGFKEPVRVRTFMYFGTYFADDTVYDVAYPFDSIVGSTTTNIIIRKPLQNRGHFRYRILARGTTDGSWYHVDDPCEFHVWWTDANRPGITLSIAEATVKEGTSFRVSATATPAPNRDIFVPISFSDPSRIDNSQNTEIRIRSGQTSGYIDVGATDKPGFQTEENLTVSAEWRSSYWLDDSVKSDKVLILDADFEISVDWSNNIALDSEGNPIIIVDDSSNYEDLHATLSVMKREDDYYHGGADDFLNGAMKVAGSNGPASGDLEANNLPAGFVQEDTRVYGRGWSTGSGRHRGGVWFFDGKKDLVTFRPVKDRLDELEGGDFVESYLNLKLVRWLGGHATLATKTLKVTIKPASSILSFSMDNYLVDEPEGTDFNATVTVNISPPLESGKSVDVFYETMEIAAADTQADEDPAKSGSDYTSAGVTAGTDKITFTEGDTSQTISIPILADSNNERNEVFQVNLLKPDMVSGETISALQGGASTISTKVTITDDPADGDPEIVLNDASVDEGIGTYNLPVNLSGTTFETVTIDYELLAAGSATKGTDATNGDFMLPGSADTGTLTIAAGTIGTTLPITVFENTEAESPETIIIKFDSPSGAVLPNSASEMEVTVTITELQVSLSWSGGISWADAEVGKLSVDESAAIASVSGNATIQKPDSSTISISAADTNAASSSGMPEELPSSASNAAGFKTEFDSDYGTWYWQDDDSGFKFDPDWDAINSLGVGGSASTTLTVQVKDSVLILKQSSITVTLEAVGYTLGWLAGFGDDLTARFYAGPKPYLVATSEDSTIYDRRLHMTENLGNTVENEKTTQVGMTPRISESSGIDFSTYPEFIGSGDARYINVLNQDFKYGTWYYREETCSNTDNYCDNYLFLPDVDSINELSRGEVVTVAFEYRLVDSSETLVSSKSLTVTIAAPTTPRMSISAGEPVTEAAGAFAAFTVVSDVDPGNSAVAVNYTATATANFIDPARTSATGDSSSITGDASLTFTDQSQNGTGPFTAPLAIPIRDNGVVDSGSQSVTVTLNADSTGTDYVVAESGSSASVVVVDELSGPIISISSPATDFIEAVGATKTYTFNLVGSTSQDVSIAYAVAPASTANPDDYTLGTASPFSIPKDGTAPVAFTVTLKDDDVYEGVEMIVLRLTSTNAVFSDGANTHDLTVTIKDDEELPTLSIKDVTQSVPEGVAATVRVKSTVATERSVMVGFTATNEAGQFLDVSSGDSSPKSMTFKPQGSEFIGELLIGTRKRTTVENDGEIKVTLATPQSTDGYKIDSSKASATFAVTDDSNYLISISPQKSPVAAGEDIVLTFQSNPEPMEELEVGFRISQTGDNLVWPVKRKVRLSSVSKTVSLTLNTIGNPESTVSGMVTVEVLDGDGYTPRNPVTVEVRKPDPATAESTKYSVVSSVITEILQQIPPTPPQGESNTAKPTLSVRAVKGSVDEGELAVFAVSASHAVSSSLPVKIKLSQTGDFVNGPLHRSVNLQEDRLETEFAVATDNDELAEPDGRITATIQTDSGYIVGTQNTAHVTVSDALDRRHRKNHVATALHAVLPDLLAHSTAKTLAIANNRITQGFSGSPTTSIELNGRSPALTALQSGGEMLNGNSTDWQSLIDDSSFTLALYPEGGETSPATVWGVGNRSSLSNHGIGGRQSWDGETHTGHFGFDAQVGPGMLAGLAVSVSQSEVGYGLKGDSGMSFDSMATGIHPYLGITTSDGKSRMQIVAGHGENNLELKQAGYLPEFLSAHYNTVAIGGSSSVYSIGSFGGLQNLELSVAGEAWHARQFVDSIAGVADSLQVDARHVRIAVEESHDHQLGIFGSLSPSVSIGLRGDGRNEKSVFGLDVTGDFEYDTLNGLAVLSSGKSLLSGLNRVHRWEIENSLNYDSGNDSKGVLFRMSRSWNGIGANSERFLWESELVDTSTYSIGNRAEGSIEIGYGFEVLDGSAMITPYSAFDHTVNIGSELRVGSRLATKVGIELGLEAVRNDPESGMVGHEYNLTGRFNW